jgi:hypothetical protein
MIDFANLAELHKRISWIYLLSSASLLLMLAGGCRSGNDGAEMFASVSSTNVQRLANLYCVFQAQHNFKGPKDEQEFKTFISNMHPTHLKNYQVDVNKLDELFISERDKLPFRIRWQHQASPRQAHVPLVFEEQGLNGKRMVGFSGFEVREVDQSEYDEYWSGKRDGETPQANRGSLDTAGGK